MFCLTHEHGLTSKPCILKYYSLKYRLRHFICLLLILLSFYQTKAQSIIVGDISPQNVIFNDIPDVFLPLVINGVFNFDIDINFDNVNDIRFQRGHSASPAFISESYMVMSLSNIQFVCLPGIADADTLFPGSIINKYLNWNNGFNNAYLYFYHSQNLPPPATFYTHGICNKPNRYIGFRKIMPEDTIYGWFNFDLGGGPFVLKSFAINKKVDVPPIDTLPQYGQWLAPSDELIVYPNPARDHIHIRNTADRPSIYGLSINNILGQKVFSSQINFTGEYSLDIGNFNSGMYIITLQNEQYLFVNKMIFLK